jgi:hypothetical protein
MAMATKRAKEMAARAMVLVMKRAMGDGGKRDGDGNDKGNGEGGKGIGNGD